MSQTKRMKQTLNCATNYNKHIYVSPPIPTRRARQIKLTTRREKKTRFCSSFTRMPACKLWGQRDFAVAFNLRMSYSTLRALCSIISKHLMRSRAPASLHLRARRLRQRNVLLERTERCGGSRPKPHIISSLNSF